MNLSTDTRVALNLSLVEAAARRHEFVGLEHLLHALVRDEGVGNLLESLGVDPDALLDRLEEVIESTHTELPDDGKAHTVSPTLAFQRVLQRAASHALGAGVEEVTPSNLLAAFFDESDSHAVWLLESHGLDRLRIVTAITAGADQPLDSVGGDADGARAPGGRPAQQDPLEAYTVNLNERAARGEIDRLIGRDEEIERCVTILSRRRKNNPILVGESGVGKTAIAEGLARRIVEGEVPRTMRNAVIHALDPGTLLAGTRYRGDFEDRLKGVLKRLAEEPGAILFIDEIHNIVRMGAVEGGTMDASNLLKPALADGTLRCIGSTTFEEYRRHFEKDRALARRFQKVDVEEPDEADARAILEGLRERYEDFHDVTYLPEALDAAVRLSARRLPDRRLPDKAIDLIDEAGAIARLRAAGMGSADLPSGGDAHDSESGVQEDGGCDSASDSAGERPVVGRREIEAVVARIARIPEEEASVDDRARLASLEADLKGVVFGQDNAIEALVAAVKLGRAGLGAPERPQGAYLFTGPTGVGKTEVARQLARTLGVPLLRFDMSEYMERHAVSRLIGAPPGYVGFEQGGQLTEAVSQSPHCVVLLDEVEKAHPDVYNVLLQVMDHGRLTDNNGRVADFRNAFLIMTSNVGARELASLRIGFSSEVRTGSDEAAFRAAFSPEFRNRLDARIAFSALGTEHMPRIVRKFLQELEQQLAERRVSVEATDAALRLLAEEGFDPVLGARPLARVIRERVKRPLSEAILFGDLQSGGHARIRVAAGALVFEFEPRPDDGTRTDDG